LLGKHAADRGFSRAHEAYQGDVRNVSAGSHAVEVMELPTRRTQILGPVMRLMVQEFLVQGLPLAFEGGLKAGVTPMRQEN
jgi:hypothetical protein